MYVTYSDLIQIGIFIVALIGLCYTIFGRKNSRPLPRIVNG
ncbi:MAG: putative holin-like toxin [Lachnospiraceae bacterium]